MQNWYRVTIKHYLKRSSYIGRPQVMLINQIQVHVIWNFMALRVVLWHTWCILLLDNKKRSYSTCISCSLYFAFKLIDINVKFIMWCAHMKTIHKHNLIYVSSPHDQQQWDLIPYIRFYSDRCYSLHLHLPVCPSPRSNKGREDVSSSN